MSPLGRPVPCMLPNADVKVMSRDIRGYLRQPEKK